MIQLSSTIPDVTLTDSPTFSSTRGLVRLDFKELDVFERVLDQYRGLGVRFEAAIALFPSNPAFTAQNRDIVLMPEGNRTEVISHFCQPIHSIEAVVSCTTSVTMAAYNCDGEVLTQLSTTAPKQNLKDGEPPDALPLQSLQLAHPDIRKAVIYSTSPFTIGLLCFE